jgi:hypothetical protein
MVRVSLHLDEPNGANNTQGPTAETTTTETTDPPRAAAATPTTAEVTLTTPAEPRLPYAADAGSYTKIWQEQSIGITLQITITEVKEFLAHYSGAKPDLQAIGEAIISSCRNLTFLTIMKDSRVCLMHSIGKCSLGLGRPTPAHRRVFGLIGEKVGAELPPAVMAPSSGLKDWIRAQEIREPTDKYLDALKDEAKTLLPAPPDQSDETKVSVMNICYLPRVWAPYFLAETSPYVAWRMARTLLVQLPESARDNFDYLDSWLKIACTSETADKSQLCAAWQSPRTDREQRRWMQQHTAGLNAVTSMLPSPAPANGGLSTDAVEIQYLAPLSSCYSFTVAQVTVKGFTRNVSLVTFSLRFN